MFVMILAVCSPIIKPLFFPPSHLEDSSHSYKLDDNSSFPRSSKKAKVTTTALSEWDDLEIGEGPDGGGKGLGNSSGEFILDDSEPDNHSSLTRGEEKLLNVGVLTRVEVVSDNRSNKDIRDSRGIHSNIVPWSLTEPTDGFQSKTVIQAGT